MLFVALTLDFPGGLAHWFSLVHIPYRCERAAQRYPSPRRSSAHVRFA